MDYAEARRHMVNSQVRTNDVTDLRLQTVLEATPRERFLPPGLRNQAYAERDIPAARGRVTLRAGDSARLVPAPGLTPADLVLDAACGSGYSTAVLAGLAEMVVGVEGDETLAAAAQQNLSDIGVDNAAVVVADPAKGVPAQGPFDVIFLGGGVAVEPEALLTQLKPGGRLVAIRRENGVSRGVVWRRHGDAFAARALFDAGSAAVLPEFEAPKSFRF